MKISHIIGAIIGLLTFGPLMAQGRKLVDRRDQAQGWFVPVQGQALVNGRKTKNVEVILYRNNDELGRIPTKRNGKFRLELDIDQSYAVRIKKEGYQEKLFIMDTTLPKDLVLYPDYFCFVDLAPVTKQLSDPFYHDFPSAIIRYDAIQGGFYHSDPYLAHIQTRLYGFARAGNK
jgi:hypothetical protein